MLIYSGTMLGVSTAKAIFKKQPTTDEK